MIIKACFRRVTHSFLLTMEDNTSEAQDLSLCGNLTLEYEQLWRAYEFWCEGVLFTSLGIFGKLDSSFKEYILYQSNNLDGVGV